MCITRVSEYVDLNTLSREQKETYMSQMKERRKHLRAHLKKVEDEIAKVSRSQVTVSLREVRRG